MGYARKWHFHPLELKCPINGASNWYEFHVVHIKQIFPTQQLFSQCFRPLSKVSGSAEGMLRGDQMQASGNTSFQFGHQRNSLIEKGQYKESLTFLLVNPLILNWLVHLFKHPIGKGTNPSIWRVYCSTFFVPFILGLFLAFGLGRLRLYRHLWLQCIYT